MKDKCSRCAIGAGFWDLIGGNAICPDCEMRLILNEGPGLVCQLVGHRCVLCGAIGTVPYETWVRKRRNIELDLCPKHFRRLLSRDLKRRDVRGLWEWLAELGLCPGDFFFLNGSFYDERGRALMPVKEES